MIYVLFGIYGLHKGAIEPVQRSFVAELSPPEFKASGLGSFQMVVGLCALPASLIAGILWDTISPSAPFYFSLSLTLVVSILLLFAYPDRLAKQRSKNSDKYKLSNSKGAILNVEDTLFNQEFLVVSNLSAHVKDSYINMALSISLQQIEEYFPQFLITKESINYNKEKKQFDIRENRYFLELELSSKPSKTSEKHNYNK